MSPAGLGSAKHLPPFLPPQPAYIPDPCSHCHDMYINTLGVNMCLHPPGIYSHWGGLSKPLLVNRQAGRTPLFHSITRTSPLEQRFVFISHKGIEVQIQKGPITCSLDHLFIPGFNATIAQQRVMLARETYQRIEPTANAHDWQQCKPSVLFLLHKSFLYFFNPFFHYFNPFLFGKQLFICTWFPLCFEIIAIINLLQEENVRILFTCI